MHELPITQSILDLTLEHAAKAGGGRVTGIHLVIGELSRVVDDCVQFYWDLISEGTPAQGAVLHFRRVPLEFSCRDCGEVFRPREALDYRCTSCRGSRVRVEKGDEFRLEAIDLEPVEASSTETRSPSP
jgi:hydrogenase nickel incorporation protein HypA/HybF